ncbi:MAG: SulP family inorganic anion transporter [Actinomycetota bacterium]|nr:SulP family inorganic anion transporter [Actinomycetota bacterium]
MRLPVLGGVLPIPKSRLGPDALAGITLAALAIPEVLGYARIAGMPVVTGLYTMLVPMAVFALVGSSRHLVVAADSATAAILAAGLAGVAVAGSPRYVQLAGTAALLVGGLLILAWLVRLGFLANFLSRTVLVGFLTGVGIQVAGGQLAQMLGITAAGSHTAVAFIATLKAFPHTNVAAALVSLGVLVLVVGVRRLTRRIPGALIAVVGAIALSRTVDLTKYGVEVLGEVPHGLAQLTAPSVTPADLRLLLPTAVSMFVVIVAQSSATSRAYAAGYDETLSEDLDLVGLAGANVSAAFTGAFVVNGSPTKTQMVDSAGGRSQLSQLTAAVVVLLVVLLLTGPLAYLPIAALATVVFVIGIELIDVAGMRRIYALRREEFVVAVLTATAVVFLGVEQGVLLAIVASIIDHLRHSYHPRSSVLTKSAAGHWQSTPVSAGARTTDGLVIYRFGTSLYFANAASLAADITTLTQHSHPPRWLCLDGAAIGDVDYTAAAVVIRVHQQQRTHGTRLVLSNIIEPVRAQLDRYGITTAVGSDAYFGTAGEALEAFEELNSS